MNCPRDGKTELVQSNDNKAYNYAGLKVFRCPNCGGQWIEK